MRGSETKMKMKNFIVAFIVLMSTQLGFAQSEEDIDSLNEITGVSHHLQQEFESYLGNLDGKELLLAGLFLRSSQSVYDTAQHARTVLLFIELVDKTRIDYANMFFNADLKMLKKRS